MTWRSSLLAGCKSSSGRFARDAYMKGMVKDRKWSQSRWAQLWPDAVVLNGGPHHRAQEIECAVKDRMAAGYATNVSDCRRDRLSQMSGLGAPDFASTIGLSRLFLQLGRDAELFDPRPREASEAGQSRTPQRYSQPEGGCRPTLLRATSRFSRSRASLIQVRHSSPSRPCPFPSPPERPRPDQGSKSCSKRSAA